MRKTTTTNRTIDPYLLFVKEKIFGKEGADKYEYLTKMRNVVIPPLDQDNIGYIGGLFMRKNDYHEISNILSKAIDAGGWDTDKSFVREIVKVNYNFKHLADEQFNRLSFPFGFPDFTHVPFTININIKFYKLFKTFGLLDEIYNKLQKYYVGYDIKETDNGWAIETYINLGEIPSIKKRNLLLKLHNIIEKNKKHNILDNIKVHRLINIINEYTLQYIKSIFADINKEVETVILSANGGSSYYSNIELIKFGFLRINANNEYNQPLYKMLSLLSQLYYSYGHFKTYDINRKMQFDRWIIKIIEKHISMKASIIQNDKKEIVNIRFKRIDGYDSPEMKFKLHIPPFKKEDDAVMNRILEKVQQKFGDEFKMSTNPDVPEYQKIVYALQHTAGTSISLEDIELCVYPKFSSIYTEAIINTEDSHKNKHQLTVPLIINEDIPVYIDKITFEAPSQLNSYFETAVNNYLKITEKYIIPQIAKQISEIYKIKTDNIDISYNKKHLKQKLLNGFTYIIQESKLRAIDKITNT